MAEGLSPGWLAYARDRVTRLHESCRARGRATLTDTEDFRNTTNMLVDEIERLRAQRGAALGIVASHRERLTEAGRDCRCLGCEMTRALER